MKWIISISLLFFCQSWGFSQLTAERQVISSTGSLVQDRDMYASQSIGEWAITTLSSGTLVLTQGFQQPLKGEPEHVTPPSEISIEYKLYPNPAQDYMILELASAQPMQPVVEVFDAAGRRIDIFLETPSPSSFVRHRFEVGDLPAGHYFLRLHLKGSRQVKSIIFQKR